MMCFKVSEQSFEWPGLQYSVPGIYKLLTSHITYITDTFLFSLETVGPKAGPSRLPEVQGTEGIEAPYIGKGKRPVKVSEKAR